MKSFFTSLEKVLNGRSAGRIALVLLLALFVSVVSKSYTSYESTKTVYTADAINSVETRLDSLADDLTNTYTDGQKDLAALEGVMEAYTLTDPNDSTLYERRFSWFSERHPEYYLLQYQPYGTTTQKAIRDAYGSYAVSYASTTQENSYFRNLESLSSSFKDGQVFISSLVDSSSTDGLNTSIPVVYAMSPIIVHGQLTGFLEAIVNPEFAFDEIAHAARPGEWVVLVDNQGNYLVSGGPRHTSSAISGDYPSAITDQLFGNDASGSFAYGGYEFSYRHIMIPGFVLQKDKYPYWTIVSISQDASLFQDDGEFLQQFIAAVVLAVALIACIGCLVLWMSRRMEK